MRSLGRRFLTKQGTIVPVLRALLYLVASWVSTFILAFIIAVIAVFAFGAKTPDDPSDEGFYLTVAAPICASALAIAFRRFVDHRSIASLGITFDRSWWRMLVAGCLLAAISQLPRIVWGYAHGSAVWDSTLVGGQVDLGIGAASRPEDVLLLAASAVWVTVVFRGYVFQNVWEQWGPVPALIVSAGCQVLLSGWSLPDVVEVVLLSLYSGLTVLWTRSIWLAMGFFLANALIGPFAQESASDVTLDVVGIIIVTALSLYIFKRQKRTADSGEDYQRDRP